MILYLNYIILSYLKFRFNCPIALGGSGIFQIEDGYFEKLNFNLVVDKFHFSKIDTKHELFSFLDITPAATENNPQYHSIPIHGLRNLSDLKYGFNEILDYAKLKQQFSYAEEKPSHYLQMFSMKLSDGCVGKCAFCGDSDKDLNIYNFDLSIDVIKKYLDMGYNCAFFFDSAINPNRKFTDKLCNAISKNNLKFIWSASARFHHTDYDFFKMCYESGCRRLCFGTETTSASMLKYIDKNITPEKIQTGLLESHRAGIWNLLNFIFGFPFETDNDVISTISFIKDNQPYIDECVTNRFYMHPYSRFYRHPELFNLQVSSQQDPNFYRTKAGPSYQCKVTYNEVDGLLNEEIENYKDRMFELIDNFFTTDQVRVVPIHLTFLLFQLLGDKTQVRKIIDQHYITTKNKAIFR